MTNPIKRSFARTCCLLMLMCALDSQGVLADGMPTSAGRPARTGRLTVTFHGLRSRDGVLRVGLYDAAASFPDGTPAARQDIVLSTLSAQASLDALTVTFSGLRPGRYAVCAFHDRKATGKLTQNFLGIPTEEWGMSNNPRPQLRAPRFSEARFDLAPPTSKAITITLGT